MNQFMASCMEIVTFAKDSNKLKTIILAILTLTGGLVANADTLEQQFRELPMEARQFTSPFFWPHGDESKERLEMYVGRVAEPERWQQRAVAVRGEEVGCGRGGRGRADGIHCGWLWR